MKRHRYFAVVGVAALCVGVLMLGGCRRPQSSGRASHNDSEKIKIELLEDSAKAGDSGVVIDGRSVTITRGGHYELTGSLYEGQVIVDAGTADVQLTLDRMGIDNSSDACFCFKKAGSVTIVVGKGGRNVVHAKGTKKTKEEPACIYSKCDLYITGKGTLSLDADVGNDIDAKDSLEISGNPKLELYAKKDAIRANDALTIQKGDYRIRSGKDAIHCDEGDIRIEGGRFELEAEDDAIHAERDVLIKDGRIVVTGSKEGIEGADVEIAGGTVSVTSEDDGINASGEKGSLAELKITGGSVEVDAGGDGVDANGAFFVSGGTTLLSGSADNANGAIDYDTEAVITGGTVVAAGFPAEAKGFEKDSPQPSWSVDLKKKHREKIVLLDESGEQLITYKPPKEYRSVVVSVPEMKPGRTYTLKTGKSCEILEKGLR